MKELLRIAMSAKQVREACAEWAEKRGSVEDASIAVDGLPADIAVSVVFSKKRARAGQPKELSQ